MAWCHQLTSHYSKWSRSSMAKGICRPQWIKICTYFVVLHFVVFLFGVPDDPVWSIWCIIQDHFTGAGSIIWLRADFKFAFSQWETSLQSNAVSHWLGAYLESTLWLPWCHQSYSEGCEEYHVNSKSVNCIHILWDVLHFLDNLLFVFHFSLPDFSLFCILFYFQGKYMDIEFDFKGDPVGGVITNCK